MSLTHLTAGCKVCRINSRRLEVNMLTAFCYCCLQPKESARSDHSYCRMRHFAVQTDGVQATHMVSKGMLNANIAAWKIYALCSYISTWWKFLHSKLSTYSKKSSLFSDETCHSKWRVELCGCRRALKSQHSASGVQVATTPKVRSEGTQTDFQAWSTAGCGDELEDTAEILDSSGHRIRAPLPSSPIRCSTPLPSAKDLDETYEPSFHDSHL